MNQNNQQQQQNPTTSPNNNNGQQPSGPSKRNLIISGAVILTVLVALFVVPGMRSGDQTDNTSDTVGEETALPEGCKPGYAFSETTGEPCPVPEAPSEEVAGESTEGSTQTNGTLSRAAATAAFAGKVLTITGACEVSPEKLTVSSGTTIMLDNASSEPHTVVVGGKSYTISPLHYRLAWLRGMSGELAVTCDGEAAGAVTLQ